MVPNDSEAGPRKNGKKHSMENVCERVVARAC